MDRLASISKIWMALVWQMDHGRFACSMVYMYNRYLFNAYY